MTLLQMAEWLESTSPALMVRESLWGFPAVVGAHLVGLSLSVGMVLWFDLRLLGVVLPNQPVRTVYRRVMPWAAAGFVLMALSGGLLFAGYATRAYVNRAFQLKMAAMLVAGLNAWRYHRFETRTMAVWNADAVPPRRARVAGLVSLLAWALVVLAGRVMSYTMF